MSWSTRDWPEHLMGLGLVLAGGIIGFEAATLKVGPMHAKVGPAAFLWFSAILLSLCGVMVAVRAFRMPKVSGVEISRPLIIVAGLAASVFLMEPLGFVPTATLIFLLTARGIGSSRWLRDLIIGVILAAAAFAVFSLGLGLRLPVGSLFT